MQLEARVALCIRVHDDEQVVQGHDLGTARGHYLLPGTLHGYHAYAIRPWDVTDEHALDAGAGPHRVGMQDLLACLAVYHGVVWGHAEKAGKQMLVEGINAQEIRCHKRQDGHDGDGEQ